MKLADRVQKMQQSGASAADIANAIAANKRRNSFLKWGSVGILAASIAALALAYLPVRTQIREAPLIQKRTVNQNDHFFSIKIDGRIEAAYLDGNTINVLFDPSAHYKAETGNMSKKLVKFDLGTRKKTEDRNVRTPLPDSDGRLTEFRYQNIIVKSRKREIVALKEEEVVWSVPISFAKIVDVSVPFIYSHPVRADVYCHSGMSYLFIYDTIFSNPDSNASTFTRVDIITGNTTWSHTFVAERAPRRPRFIGNEIFLTFDSGEVIALDVATGEEKFKFKTFEDPFSYFVAGADSNGIYLFTNDTILGFKLPQ